MEGSNIRWRRITPELQQAARRLRAEATSAEEMLWNALRARQLKGLRIRRQHPVGQCILDFYCPRHKLGVELDGGVHTDRAEEDAARTVHLNSFGYHVLRFANEQVVTDLPTVLEQIAACNTLSETPSETSNSPIIGG